MFPCHQNLQGSLPVASFFWRDQYPRSSDSSATSYVVCESLSHRDMSTAETGRPVSELLKAWGMEKSISTRKTIRKDIMMLKNHRFASML